jgi:hypothetical protein
VQLLEDGIEVGGEGVEDASTQGVGDVGDVVEQLRSGALGGVLELDQAGVQGAQLLVGGKGGVVGGAQLGVGVFAGWSVAVVDVDGCAAGSYLSSSTWPSSSR